MPKGFIGRRYAADSSLVLLERPGSEAILRFGSSGLADVIGIDLATGHVVEIINAPHSAPLFVNTSIEQFVRTVRAIINRFPYYDSDADEYEIQTVANELREIIRHIDLEAAVPDRYWSTFVDDVEIGDLSTEAILAIL
ncbi:MAG: SUKH-4 family immunity protein [Streptosporangiaceae bacterium]